MYAYMYIIYKLPLTTPLYRLQYAVALVPMSLVSDRSSPIHGGIGDGDIVKVRNEDDDNFESEDICEDNGDVGEDNDGDISEGDGDIVKVKNEDNNLDICEDDGNISEDDDGDINEGDGDIIKVKNEDDDSFESEDICEDDGDIGEDDDDISEGDGNIVEVKNEDDDNFESEDICEDDGDVSEGDGDNIESEDDDDIVPPVLILHGCGTISNISLNTLQSPTCMTSSSIS